MSHPTKVHGIYSIDDLKEHYERKTQGHWFKQDTMRFFKSRLSSDLFYKDNKVYFVSSEQNRLNDPRRYSIREYNTVTGDIETVGLGFQGYKTLAAAKLAARNIIK